VLVQFNNVGLGCDGVFLEEKALGTFREGAVRLGEDDD
jgi:hypothetical protein